MAGLNHKVHGGLDLRIGCAAAQSARFFQIIPSKMKRAISARKATLMHKNTSAADRGSCHASHLAKPRESIIQARNCCGSNAEGASCERRRHPRRPEAKWRLPFAMSGLPRKPNEADRLACPFRAQEATTDEIAANVFLWI